MEVNINDLQKKKPKRPTYLKSFFEKAYEHKELIATLFSGLLILVTWSLESVISHPLWVTLHLIAFAIGGYAKAKEGITETVRNKELNVEMLMIIAAIGAVVIGYWTEGAILIFIFALSGALETYSMNKSKKEISSLMDIQPEEANILKNEQLQTVPVSLLNIGDLMLVRAGERIPADGEIVKGASAIDESAITGESIPVQKEKKGDVYAGTVALDGTLYVKITKPASETLFQKIIDLVQQAQEEKSPSQLFIERFEGTYVKVVLVVVAFMMFLPYFLFGWSLSESIYRAMILLVVASPCALVASIMPATLSAISNNARKGVLLKGGVHAENLSHIKAFAFDKTGTLTRGKPEVTDALYHPEHDENETLHIVGKIEGESTHPLALALTRHMKNNVMNAGDIEITGMKTLSGKGVTAKVNQDEWMIGNPDFIGREEAERFLDGALDRLASQGKTVIFAKKNDDIVAVFALKDTIRKTAKKAINLLNKHGIHTIMLTGDNERTAKAIAKEAGLEEYIANCLPEQKVEYIKELRKIYKQVAMVGDGINDAPALATANIGIAMGEGTDVALDTADIVLMKNDLSKITEAIGLSGRMNRVVKQNVVFSISVIVILIFSNFLQIIDIPLGVIAHEGSTILVILNGLRLLR